MSEAWFAYAHGDGMAMSCEELLGNATAPPPVDDDDYLVWRRDYIGCLGVTWERIEAQLLWSIYAWLAFIALSAALHRALVLARPRRRGGGWDRPACCLLYTSPSPRDRTRSRMPSSA